MASYHMEINYLTFAFWIVYLSTGDAQTEFEYDGEAGPAYWSSRTRACGGEDQSPINIIPSSTIYDERLTGFRLINDSPKFDRQFLMSNNGNTVMVELVGDQEVIVMGGNLQSNYKITQFHFHWGSKSEQGSEHLIDGKAAPLEMHIVAYDHLTYESFSEALNFEEAIAVFALHFELSPTNNSALQIITDNLREVKWSNRREKLVLPPLVMDNIFPQNNDDYYRYRGSLTTPPCSETVVWTIFQQKAYISEKQLKMFRQLATIDDLPLVDNFRPPQKLNGRKVWNSNGRNVNTKSSTYKSTSSSVSRNRGGFILVLLTFMFLLTS